VLRERNLLRGAAKGPRVFSISSGGRGRTGQLHRWRRLAAGVAVLALTSAVGLSQALADDDDDEPTASFTFSPSSPLTAQTVTFTSTSVAGEGSITSETWDLDNDGAFDDASGRTASRSFATAGSYTVRLRVRNSRNRSDTTSRTVTVSNRAPTASFTFAPAAPLSGQSIEFDASGSSDPDGTIASVGWDLNNNGVYGDASGTKISHSFATPGTYTVGLRVTDNSGASATTSRTITVGNRPPTASVGSSPAAPLTRDMVNLSVTASDPDGTIASRSWDLDADGDFDDGSGSTASRSFARAGTYTVAVRVVDNHGAATTASRTITVGNRAPSASFGQSPSAPLTGEPVRFSSSSSDPDGTIETAEWDLDNDGQYDDGAGGTASRSFARPGTYTVGLRVVDDLGAASSTSRSVSVGNRGPAANISHSPAAPRVGEAVAFSSGASDPDGSIASAAWDLDGDGAYDDASGESASRSFVTPGTYTVAVRVTDDHGASAVGSRTVEVAATPPPGSDGSGAGGAQSHQDPQSFDDPGAPTPPPPVTPPTDPGATPVLQWLQPFPVIRIRGRTTGRGAQVTVLSVTAPSGSLIAARCSGRGCPVRRTRAQVSARGRRVRLRAFERHLRAGIRLEIFVTKPGVVGKYTRFRINRLKPPQRVDSCVLPGSRRPARCPS
jgi:PKD repeat protein